MEIHSSNKMFGGNEFESTMDTFRYWGFSGVYFYFIGALTDVGLSDVGLSETDTFQYWGFSGMYSYSYVAKVLAQY